MLRAVTYPCDLDGRHSPLSCCQPGTRQITFGWIPVGIWLCRAPWTLADGQRCLRADWSRGKKGACILRAKRHHQAHMEGQPLECAGELCDGVLLWIHVLIASRSIVQRIPTQRRDERLRDPGPLEPWESRHDLYRQPLQPHGWLLFGRAFEGVDQEQCQVWRMCYCR